MEGMKVCSKCKQEKLLSEFSWQKGKNCYQSHCKICRCEDHRIKMDTNMEFHKRQLLCMKRWRERKRATDPEWRQKENERNSEYGRTHREQIRMNNRKRYVKKDTPIKKKNKVICDIIKQHHKEMKNDPEHLTTEFIQKIVKVDCDV